MGWPHVENLEGYLSCRGPPWAVRGPSPTMGSPSQSTSAKKRIPHIYLWKSTGIPFVQMRRKAAGNTGILFNSPCTDSLTQRHSPWARGGTVAQGAPGTHTGRNPVVWLKGEGWRDSHHCPHVEPSFHTAGMLVPSLLCGAPPPHSQIWIWIGLINTTWPTLMTLWDSSPPIHTARGTFSDKQPSLARASLETLDWWAADLSVPCSSEWIPGSTLNLH